MKGTRNGVRGKAAAVAALSAALLVPLATFGGPALARSGAALAEYGHGSGSAQYQYRVTICHITHGKKKVAHTITVSSKAVPAHLRHGDHLNACNGTETRPTKHGQSGDQHGAAPQHGGGKDHKGK
ncbi:MAG TPA: hypothetical protein VFJ78_05690 [Gaiellaceae bacterium]|nr:hypothetical protein [Gaiellaceae bacterium]